MTTMRFALQALNRFNDSPLFSAQEKSDMADLFRNCRTSDDVINLAIKYLRIFMARFD